MTGDYEWDPERMLAFGPCFGCKQPFGFNPQTVISIPIDPQTQLPPDLGGDPDRAVNMPLCNQCVTDANAVRRRMGNPLLWHTSPDSTR